MRAFLELLRVEVRHHRLAIWLYTSLLAIATLLATSLSGQPSFVLASPMLLYSSLAYGLLAIALQAMPRERRLLGFFDRMPRGLALTFLAKLAIAWLVLGATAALAWGAYGSLRASWPTDEPMSIAARQHEDIALHVLWGACAAVPWLLAATTWLHKGALAGLLPVVLLVPHALWVLADPRHLLVYPVFDHVFWLLPLGTVVAGVSFVLGLGRGGSSLRATGLGVAAGALLLVPLWVQLGWWAHCHSTPEPGRSLILWPILAPDRTTAYLTLGTSVVTGKQQPTFAVRADLDRGSWELLAGKDSFVQPPFSFTSWHPAMPSTVRLRSKRADVWLDAASGQDLSPAQSLQALLSNSEIALRERRDADLRACSQRSLPDGGHTWLAFATEGLASGNATGADRYRLVVYRSAGSKTFHSIPGNALFPAHEFSADWRVVMPSKVGRPRTSVFDLGSEQWIDADALVEDGEQLTVLGSEWLVHSRPENGMPGLWVRLDPTTGQRRPAPFLGRDDTILAAGPDRTVLVAVNRFTGLVDMARVDVARQRRRGVGLPANLNASCISQVSCLPVPPSPSPRRHVLRFTVPGRGTWIAHLLEGEDCCSRAVPGSELLGYDRLGWAFVIDHNRTHILRADLDRGTWQLAWPRE